VYDRSGQLSDADDVTCDVLDPSGSVRHLEVAHDSTGRYSAEVIGDMEGRWHFKWTSISPSAVDEGPFRITRSAFP
jgi:hypothetical protein